MYERYRGVESVAYDLRKRLKQKTRVKIGREDIELHTREASSTVWRKQVLPDSLLEFEMTEFRPTLLSSSPPPGRPGRPQGQHGLAIASGGDMGGMEEESVYLAASLAVDSEAV